MSQNEEDYDLDCIIKGYCISVALLIVYLSIFALDKRLTIIWLISAPAIFLALVIYDFSRNEPFLVRGIYTDGFLAVCGPITIIAILISFSLILKGLHNEEYEESSTEERNGDTGHDEHEKIRGKQKEEKQSESKKSSQIKGSQCKEKE